MTTPFVFRPRPSLSPARTSLKVTVVDELDTTDTCTSDRLRRRFQRPPTVTLLTSGDK
jgi:hypothetical protein